MTEARLTSAGVIALDAERGAGPRVPVVLINGDMHVDGSSPPLSPNRVLAAFSALVEDPDLSDDDLIDRVGPPVVPTGCDVACDYLALARGEPTEMTCTAQLIHETLDRLITLTCLPPGVADDTLTETIAARVAAMNTEDPYWRAEHVWDSQIPLVHPGVADAIPLADVRNETSGAGWGTFTRIVCELLPDGDLAACEQQIKNIWGVTTRRQVQLPASLPQLMHDLIDVDIDAQHAALAALDALANFD